MLTGVAVADALLAVWLLRDGFVQPRRGRLRVSVGVALLLAAVGLVVIDRDSPPRPLGVPPGAGREV